eukprot:3217066-Alexandrium_andersonii.AAC.1
MGVLDAAPKNALGRRSVGEPTTRAGLANGASVLGPSGGTRAHATASDHARTLADAAENRP